jgi:hypothetical protein
MDVQHTSLRHLLENIPKYSEHQALFSFVEHNAGVKIFFLPDRFELVVAEFSDDFAGLLGDMGEWFLERIVCTNY